jgi:D-beta-D-heptose 7-phosphate kinase/D-beta-D-heptose 1-phosphate adenosyltransferase
VSPKRARDKMGTLVEVSRKVSRARRAGEVIVFTNGCFDLLHVGHIRSLEQARLLGDRLIVAINLDASVRRVKGPDRPILPARARMELVAALGCVDWVVGFGADTPIRLIRSLQPDVLVKGGDWALDEIVGGKDVTSWGGRIVRSRIVPGVRTSSLIEKIKNRSPRLKR